MATKSIFKLKDDRITSNSIVHKSKDGDFINLEQFLNDLIKYKPGDTLEMLGTSIDLAGCITGSAKGLHFTLFTQKKLDDIKEVKIDVLKANTRIANGGYLDDKAFVSGGYNYLELYSCAATVRSSNSIKFIVEKTSAFKNTTNNIPVTVSIDSIKLTFKDKKDEEDVQTNQIEGEL